MPQFNSIHEVWAALDAGKTVYWKNKSYKVYIEDNTGPSKNYPGRLYSARGDKMLCIRCISNYFGGIIHPAELADLFTEERT